MPPSSCPDPAQLLTLVEQLPTPTIILDRALEVRAVNQAAGERHNERLEALL
jgi:hypothetical protein